MDASHVTIIVMDVDGTLTDGTILMGSKGEIAKAFNVKDGYAIKNILPRLLITPVIITGRTSSITELRCKELGITELYQNVQSKISVLMELLEDKDASLANVVYVGDDINDLACMEAIRDGGGITACPADAVKSIRAASMYVSPLAGGHGAVRDIIEEVLLG